MSEKAINVLLGDITTIPCDVIVNAAHGHLTGGGGVDGAIHRAAGTKLVQCCQDFPFENGLRCGDGQAKITPSFNLDSCKYIIHTVAPKFVGGLIRRTETTDGEYVTSKGVRYSKELKNNLASKDEFLEKCYINSIALAEENKFNSIAFPSLGTGGHAYPIEIACPIAVRTVSELLKETEYVQEVIFVTFSEKDYKAYSEVLGLL